MLPVRAPGPDGLAASARRQRPAPRPSSLFSLSFVRPVRQRWSVPTSTGCGPASASLTDVFAASRRRVLLACPARRSCSSSPARCVVGCSPSQPVRLAHPDPPSCSRSCLPTVGNTKAKGGKMMSLINYRLKVTLCVCSSPRLALPSSREARPRVRRTDGRFDHLPLHALARQERRPQPHRPDARVRQAHEPRPGRVRGVPEDQGQPPGPFCSPIFAPASPFACCSPAPSTGAGIGPAGREATWSCSSTVLEQAGEGGWAGGGRGTSSSS